MVTSDISQLTNDCLQWRNALRTLKEEFQHLKVELQEQVKRRMPKEDLLQVEHLDNQLYIQLINIHDLKQSIKIHDRRLQLEGGAPISTSTLTQHQELQDSFQRLNSALGQLHVEFDDFCEKA
jgi:hypothetical protein